VTQVLRLGVGAPLLLFDGSGRDFPARVIASDKRGARVAVGPPGEEEPTPPLAIHLAVGVSKGERMDLIVQKAVELGVTSIRPLFTERSVVQLAGERLERRHEHWQGVLVGACEQSGRRRLPRLAPARGLGDWLAEAPASGLLLDPRADRALTEIPAPVGEVTLLVGPEGGLSPRERAQAEAGGLRGVRLGPRVLRAETAPLAAIAVIQALWGDLGHPA
jgi:16S rRNA (uracil1498-N3)-methyltransferase